MRSTFDGRIPKVFIRIHSWSHHHSSQHRAHKIVVMHWKYKIFSRSLCHERSLLKIFFIFISQLWQIGNALVCLAVYSNQSMRTVTNIFIGDLTYFILTHLPTSQQSILIYYYCKFHFTQSISPSQTSLWFYCACRQRCSGMWRRRGFSEIWRANSWFISR